MMTLLSMLHPIECFNMSCSDGIPEAHVLAAQHDPPSTAIYTSMHEMQGLISGSTSAAAATS